MNLEIKTKWLEALRSGEYKQGKHSLRDEDNKFCCLGVLCDLHSKETGTEWVGNRYLKEGMGLPFALYEWAGIKNDPDHTHLLGVVYVGGTNIAFINDQQHETFIDVAKLIEEYL